MTDNQYPLSDGRKKWWSQEIYRSLRNTRVWLVYYHSSFYVRAWLPSHWPHSLSYQQFCVSSASPMHVITDGFIILAFYPQVFLSSILSSECFLWIVFGILITRLSWPFFLLFLSSYSVGHIMWFWPERTNRSNTKGGKQSSSCARQRRCISKL